MPFRILFPLVLGLGMVTWTACKKTNSNADQPENISNAEGQAHEEEPEETILQKTSGMFKNATDSSMQAASNAGNWIKDKVNSSYEGSKEATLNAGRALQGIFEKAKEQGTTTANNLGDFVKEDFAKIGAWQYTSRTVTNEKPSDVVTMLNSMGRQKWECFWVDKQIGQTTLYFKKTPKSYFSKIPFRDLIRYVPEIAGGSEQ